MIIQNSHSRVKALVALVGILSFCALLVSLISHVTFDVMATTIFNFAIHHHFLIIFLSIVTLAVCIKIYTSLDQNIDRGYRESHSIELSKDRRQRLKVFNVFKKQQDKKKVSASKFIKTDTVGNLNFLLSDVLDTDEKKEERQKNIDTAIGLYRSRKTKAIVLFKDISSRKHIITPILHCDEECVILKAGISLPIKSIYKIEF